MTPPDPDSTPDPSTGLPNDADRLRRIRRLAGFGVGGALVLALLAGVGGASGQAGAAIFLLLSAASCTVAATYGVLTAVRDDLRDGTTVSRRRIVWVVGLFFGAAALMAMTAGVGG